MTIYEKNKKIILDVETTGLDYKKGDKIVEIGCVELIDLIPSGKTLQIYINPLRSMHKEAEKITGITNEFLKDKPTFDQIADEFLDFVKDSTLVIHNARFDIGFLNNELQICNKPLFNLEEVIDTLNIATRKFPGAPANLDALCKRFDVSLESRKVHGALIDCFLLAEVYINLIGGKQSGLSFEPIHATKSVEITRSRKYYKPRQYVLSENEKAEHAKLIEQITNSIWKKCNVTD